MSRRNGSEFIDVSLRLAVAIVAFIAFSALSLYLTDRAKFWRIVITIVIVIIVSIATAFAATVYVSHKKNIKEIELRNAEATRFNVLIKAVEQLNLSGAIIKFVKIHGTKNAQDCDWSFRDKRFSNHDLEDLTSILKKTSVPLTGIPELKNILQHYIQQGGQMAIAEHILGKPDISTAASTGCYITSVVSTGTSDNDLLVSSPYKAESVPDESLGGKMLWNILIPIGVAVVGGILIELIKGYWFN